MADSERTGIWRIRTPRRRVVFFGLPQRGARRMLVTWSATWSVRRAPLPPPLAFRAISSRAVSPMRWHVWRHCDVTVGHVRTWKMCLADAPSTENVTEKLLLLIHVGSYRVQEANCLWSPPPLKLRRYYGIEMWIYVVQMWPHRSTTYADAAHCYRPSSVVCPSVCLSHQWALQKLLNRSRCLLSWGLGWAQGIK